MAKRGSKKALSQTHEEDIAKRYGGRRSPSSGASLTDSGDVQAGDILFECKLKGHPEAPAKSTLVKQMEKVAEEAWEKGFEPAICLRFYKPDSKLADSDGWVDLTVRLTDDDAFHAEMAARYRGLL